MFLWMSLIPVIKNSVLLGILLKSVESYAQCAYDIFMKSPTPDEIKGIRKKFGWTQAEAAVLVHVTLRAWQWWESAQRTMPIGLWELLLIKAELHPNFKRKA